METFDSRVDETAKAFNYEETVLNLTKHYSISKSLTD